MKPTQTRPTLYALILVSLVANLAPSVQAQPAGTVIGTIIDETTERPLRGAQVELLGTRTGAKTDFSGRFILSATAQTYPGLAIFRPGLDFPFVIEADLTIEADQEADLGEIAVPKPPDNPDTAGPVEGEFTDGQAPAAGPDAAPPQDAVLPWIGINMIDWSMPEGRPGKPEENTVVLVQDVFQGAPAFQAGVKPKDVVLSINQKPVNKMVDFQKEVRNLSPGAQADLMILREGKVERISVQIGQITPAEIEAMKQPSGPDQGQGPAQQPRDPNQPKVFTPNSGPINPAPVQGPGYNPPPQGGQGPQGPRGPQSGGPGEQNPPPPQPEIHPLLQQARDLAGEQRFKPSDDVYGQYLDLFPNDGPIWAERAMMVFYNIQQARGMALMAQAVKRPGLPLFEKTRLRLIIAQRRLESGNLVTAKQMLIEANREDPGNPVVNDLLYQIQLIEAEMARRAAQAQGYGVQGPGPDVALQREFARQLDKAIRDMLKD